MDLTVTSAASSPWIQEPLGKYVPVVLNGHPVLHPDGSPSCLHLLGFGTFICFPVSLGVRQAVLYFFFLCSKRQPSALSPLFDYEEGN